MEIFLQTPTWGFIAFIHDNNGRAVFSYAKESQHYTIDVLFLRLNFFLGFFLFSWIAAETVAPWWIETLVGFSSRVSYNITSVLPWQPIFGTSASGRWTGRRRQREKQKNLGVFKIVYDDRQA